MATLSLGDDITRWSKEPKEDRIRAVKPGEETMSQKKKGVFYFNGTMERELRALICHLRQKERKSAKLHDMQIAKVYSEEISEFLENNGYQVIPK